MIKVNIIGGLGNQMFQYAYGKALAIKYKTDLFLDISIYETGLSNRSFDLGIFNLENVVIGSSNYLELKDWKYVVELNDLNFSFNNDPLASISNLDNLISAGNTIIILNGYWQSEKYFLSIADIVRKTFRIRESLDGKWEKLYRRIKQTTSIMINVRRGDYLNLLDYHGVVSLEYLNEAMQFMSSNVHSPIFFVFSDDIPWCRRNLAHTTNLFFVDESYYTQTFDKYLTLMTCCKHFIISNSSYAWWAAWLSDGNEKIVIAPKRWFANDKLNTIDLIPEDWIQI
ncbi:alpha-1,2-fucosyltransferase [Pedobacter borealis]|uniref:alpha-1,2-fucosyltransferase n=1 Tax=Pedobacter borealis TaxID=475254 RepID=UPI0004934A42|nr:alpha-1,2-fucosyltransferase [Pedobacter borealis]